MLLYNLNLTLSLPIHPLFTQHRTEPRDGLAGYADIACPKACKAPPVWHGAMSGLCILPAMRNETEAGAGVTDPETGMKRSKHILIGPIAAAIGLLAVTLVIMSSRPDTATLPAEESMAAEAADNTFVTTRSSAVNAVASQIGLRADAAKQPSLSRPRAIVTDGLAVGDMLDPERLHVITRPGLYGLPESRHPSGQYAILQGKLLRYDPHSMRLRAIIRSDVWPLD